MDKFEKLISVFFIVIIVTVVYQFATLNYSNALVGLQQYVSGKIPF